MDLYNFRSSAKPEQDEWCEFYEELVFSQAMKIVLSDGKDAL